MPFSIVDRNVKLQVIPAFWLGLLVLVEKFDAIAHFYQELVVAGVGVETEED